MRNQRCKNMLATLLFCVNPLTMRLAAAATDQGEAHVQIDLADKLGKVNRKVLGKNVLGYVYVKGSWPRGTNNSMQGSGLWNPGENKPVEAMMEFLRRSGTTVLRWPGGCGAHNYDWKKTVGPLKDRPMQAYGLPEFLEVCRVVGAEPVITLSDYHQPQSDLPDMVEYLNSPVGANPTGGRDWAAVRAADGHPEPYNAVMFEYGNESDHGDHRGNIFSADEYCRHYREAMKNLKAVDSRIRLGAVLYNGKKLPLRPWTEEVIEKTGDIADFYIHHAYLPSHIFNASVKDQTRYSFASARQFELFYKQLNKYIHDRAGRKVPLAITEFNNALWRRDLYNLSLGAAVQVADMMCMFMEPSLNIENAIYWQFSNELWGMVRGYEPEYDNPEYWKGTEKTWGITPDRPPYVKTPPYYAYKLFNSHLGKELLKCNVTCAGYGIKAQGHILAAYGEPRDEIEYLEEARPVAPEWRIEKREGVNAAVEEDGTLIVDIQKVKGVNYNYWHSHIELPAKPATSYLVSMEIKVVDGTGFPSFTVVDGRGYDATKSYTDSDQTTARYWKTVSASYATLPDCKSIRIQARRMHDDGNVKFAVRNVTIREIRGISLGAVPYIAALPTLHEDGKVSVILINRNVDSAMTVTLSGLHAAGTEAQTLYSPSITEDNRTHRNACVIKPLESEVNDGKVILKLPPHSVSGCTVTRPGDN